MKLTKKQVGALLNVISNDNARPILMHAKIDMFEDVPVLVATDGYTLTAIVLTDTITHQVGNLVPREALTKWHKLANYKDCLTESELVTMIVPEENNKYPNWQNVIPTRKPEAIAKISLNANYLLTMQILADANGYPSGLEWKFYGALAPVISRRDGNLYAVMPLKG